MPIAPGLRLDRLKPLSCICGQVVQAEDKTDAARAAEELIAIVHADLTQSVIVRG